MELEIGMAVKNSNNNHPYTRFEQAEMILRDELAVDRTLLANERTLLAYLRSAVSLALAGVSIMHFSAQIWFWIVGLICIPSGAAVALIGYLRYRRMNAAIQCVRRLDPIQSLDCLLDEDDA